MLQMIWVTECAFSSRQTIHFECALVSFALKTMTYHRFAAVMKVNENRHPGSSAFDPPLHQDSSFLYEVTGSNPSRAINSVHPRQARCLSIL